MFNIYLLLKRGYSLILISWTLDCCSNLPMTRTKVISLSSVKHCNFTPFLELSVFCKTIFVSPRVWKIWYSTVYKKTWLLNNIYSKHTAEANPMAASRRPFSRGPSLKYSIAITEPMDCSNIVGNMAAIRNTRGYITFGLLNISNVLVMPDLLRCSESIKENNNNQ